MTKQKIILVSIILLAISYSLFATPVFAQGNLDFLKGIVPCGTTANPRMCTVCDFFKLLQNIINFLLYVAASLATIMAVYVGFLFMFSGGSPARITDAKSKLWLLVIGLFWILGSWLVLNTILNVVAKQSVFPWPWNQINCSVQSSTPTDTMPSAGGIMLPDTAAALNEQAIRDKFQQAGISVNKSACPTGVSYQSVTGGCTSVEGLKAATIDAAIQLKNDCNCDLTITGGTESGHATGVISHSSGNKLDFRPNSALDQYIYNNFNYIGLRDDGAKQYRAPDGTLMAREGDHWDATFVR
jgi:hypothetical protein